MKCRRLDCLNLYRFLLSSKLSVLSTGTITYKLHSKQDSKAQRMALTAALDNTHTINTV